MPAGTMTIGGVMERPNQMRLKRAGHLNGRADTNVDANKSCPGGAHGRINDEKTG
jgi:hypothetical protein